MKASPGSAILSILLNNTARLGFIVAFVVFILAFLGITVFVQYKTDQDAEYISHSGELRVLSHVGVISQRVTITPVCHQAL